MENEYLTAEEVVGLTCVSKAALAQRRYKGLPPKFYKPTAKTVLYKKSEVLDWVERSVAGLLRGFRTVVSVDFLCCQDLLLVSVVDVVGPLVAKR